MWKGNVFVILFSINFFLTFYSSVFISFLLFPSFAITHLYTLTIYQDCNTQAQFIAIQKFILKWHRSGASNIFILLLKHFSQPAWFIRQKTASFTFDFVKSTGSYFLLFIFCKIKNETTGNQLFLFSFRFTSIRQSHLDCSFHPKKISFINA